MANVMFKKGVLDQLPSTYAAGTFYVTTDERAMYLDISDDTRIRLGDFQEFSTVAALEANENPAASALYYVSDINCLAKWDGEKYVQINRDTGMTAVEVTGSGNAVTAAVYSADGRKLTLTKGATFATSEYVGTIPEGYSETNIVAYINKKAEETLASATGGSSESAASVLAALNTYKAENDPKVVQAQTDIDALEEKVGDTSVSEQITSAIEALDLANTYDAKGAAADVQSALSAYETSNDTAVAAAQKAGDDAQAAADIAQDDVDALKAKVGTVPADKTVVEMIADAQTAATYDDTALAGRVTSAEGKISTLVGSVDGDDTKSVRTISAEEVAKIVAGADASFDTLKEIADWISNHSDDAASMNSAIVALQAIVDGIGDTENGEKATVVAYVNDAIAALNIGDYAKAADLTALAGRVTAVEEKFALYPTTAEVNSSLSDVSDALEARYTKEEVDDLLDEADGTAQGYANTAETNAKSYADSLAGNYDASGSAAQALADAKSYADGLASNYDATGSAAQALTDAKAYADQQVAASVLEWGSF